MKNLLQKLKRSGLTVTENTSDGEQTFEVKSTSTGGVLYKAATVKTLETLSRNISYNRKQTGAKVRAGFHDRPVINYR
jgi:hypothetical protein